VSALCAALALSPLPAPPGAPGEAAPACLHLDLQAAGRLHHEAPDTGVADLFSLPRARAGLALTRGEIAAGRAVFSAVRSGGESGAVGVDGESLVARVEIAEVRATWRRVGLALAAGLVDDAWIVTGDQAWGFRDVAPTLGEEQGWQARSDLGGALAWTAPESLATASLTTHSGEGARYRERNDGKDTTAVLTLRPLALAGSADALAVSLMGRDGSRGLNSARDHRAGARLSGALGPVALGAEAALAWGVDGDPQATPRGWSAYATLDDLRRAVAFARVDQSTALPGEPDSRALVIRAGGGARLGDAPAPLRALAGVERWTSGPQATPIAGADGQAELTRFFLQLGGHFDGAAPLQRPATTP